MCGDDIFFLISTFPEEALDKVAALLTVKIHGTQRAIHFQFFQIDHIWIEVQGQFRHHHLQCTIFLCNQDAVLPFKGAN